MSTGGDDLTLTVNFVGGDTGDSGTSSGSGSSDEGMVKDPEFQKVAAWTQSADITATESIIARRLRWIPFVSAQTAGNLAEGMSAGYYARSVRDGIVAGGQLTGSTAGSIGGAVGGSASGAVATIAGLGPLMGSMAAGATSVALAFGTLVLASRSFERSLNTLSSSIQGSAVLMSLRARQSTQLQMQREVRALNMAPSLSSLINTQTQRQIEWDQLTGTFAMAFARATEPLVKVGTQILSMINDVITPALEIIAPAVQSMFILLELTFGVISKLWNWVTGGGDDANRVPGQYWANALDPMSDENQPMEAGEVDAGIFNPRGGKLNR